MFRAAVAIAFAFAFAFVAFAAPLALAGNGTFAAGVPYAAGAQPNSVAVGDFNSDGNEDLAVANRNGSVTVNIGAGNGTFAAGVPYAAGTTPYSVAVGDFNSDGNEDLAVANNGGNVTVNIGAGNGTFAAGVPYAAGTFPSAVAVGDFNSDGNEDLAVANGGSGNVTVNIGAGNGTFAAGVPYAAGTSPYSVAVGDFNSDGNEDLVVANDGGNVTVNIGAGNGTFAAGVPYAAGTSPRSVAVGDFNSDGAEDLAVANLGNGGASNVTVNIGAGNGTFAAGVPYATGTNSYSVAVGDFNSDGNEDLAVANFSGNVTVNIGAGNGTFAAAVPYVAGSLSDSVAVGDFNSDGNEDLAVGNYGGANVSVNIGAGQSGLAGNLLANGGVEGPGAASTTPASPQIPGWTRGAGAMTFARYSVRGLFLSYLDAARREGGVNLFSGGPANALSTASQSVDVSSAAASIDAGIATARLGAELGGKTTETDSMSVNASFQDAAAAPLGSIEVGPVTAADRHNLTTLLRRAGSAPVPAGTRSIVVTLTATRTTGVYNNAYADNVKLTLDAPAPPPPGGGSGDGGASQGGADTTAPETTKGKGPKKKIHKRKASFQFSSNEAGAHFECKLDRKAAKACSSPAKAKRLKRGRHVFTATAIDAAGNRDPSPARWRFKVVR